MNNVSLSLLYTESGIFGVPLTVLLEQDQKRVAGTRIPLIFQKVSILSQIHLLILLNSSMSNRSLS